MRVLVLMSALCAAAVPAAAQQAYTITDAIKQAVHTNPGVTEAAANRRATEAELRQNQGTLLPQVRLRADYGPEKLTRHDISPAPAGDGVWRKDSREASIVVRQLLFDGLASINEIWRQTARVDAAAARVHERTELIALDAAEAYVDVVRYTRLIQLAQENVAAHRSLAGEVEQRYSGGRSGEGDLQQAQERLSGAEAVLAEFRIRLDDARAKYRRTVGLEPYNLRFPNRLPGLPGSKDDSLAVALRHNPTLRAAASDAEAARYGFRATSGAFLPTISLEGSASKGVDSQDVLGRREDLSGKIVASWDIFRGGQDMWRRAEMADRMIEQTQRLARLQRDAFESLDKAWAARTLSSERLAALNRQSTAAFKVIGAYTKEYELGQRTLIDLLDARNSYFNSLVSIISTRALAVFADYQLLAAMGHLLEYIKTAPPPEADPLAQKPFGLYPLRLPPVIVNDPDVAPEPLNVNGAVAPTPYLWGPKVVMFGDRAPGWAVAESPASKVTDFSAAARANATPSTIDSRWPEAVSAFSSRDAERMAGPFVTLPRMN